MSKDNDRNVENCTVAFRIGTPILYPALCSTKDQYCDTNIGNYPTLTNETSSCVSSLSDSDTESIVQNYSPSQIIPCDSFYENFGSHEHQPTASGPRKRKMAFNERMERKKYCVKDAVTIRKVDFNINLGYEQHHRQCYQRRSLDKNNSPQIYERPVSCPTTSASKQPRGNLTIRRHDNVSCKMINDHNIFDRNNKNGYNRTIQQHDKIKNYHNNANTSHTSSPHLQSPAFNSPSMLPSRSTSDSFITLSNKSSILSLYDSSHMRNKFHHNLTRTTTEGTKLGKNSILDSQPVSALIPPENSKQLDQYHTAFRNDDTICRNAITDVCVDGIVSLSSISISSGPIPERECRRSLSEDILYHTEKILNMPLKVMKAVLVKKETYLECKGGYLT